MNCSNLKKPTTMKRIFILSVALLLGLFAGCSDAEERIDHQQRIPVLPAPKSVPMRIAVGQHPDANPETRVSLSGDKTAWELGDQIAVKFVDAEGVVHPTIFTIEEPSDILNEGKLAYFRGMAPVGSYTHLAALYPASGRETATTQLTLTQTDHENLFLSACNDYVEEPLVLSEQEAPIVNLQFAHLMHKIDFTLKMAEGFMTDDFNPAINGEETRVIVELTVKSSRGVEFFPLVCSYDVVKRDLVVQKSARANTIVLTNHNFTDEPTVSMLLFPQDFGEQVSLVINLYINGVKRYQIRKPNGDALLDGLVMSPGRSTTISMVLNDEVKVQEIDPQSVFGDGTEDDPYIIADYVDLCNMRSMLSESTLQDKHFMQVADIHLGNEAWAPAQNTFEGCFEGNGYTMTVGPEGFAGEDSGLFYALGDGGEIKNLNIVCDQTSQTGGQSFGLLANQTYEGSLISNCHVSGEFSGVKSGNRIYWGGLVGRSEGGVIRASSFVGTIKGDINNGKATMGGLIAEVDGPVLIINSFVAGTVANDPAMNGNTNAFYMGGFIGRNNGATIANCYSRGVMYALSRGVRLGGFVGDNISGDIRNCYSLVDLTSVESNKEAELYTFIAEHEQGELSHNYDLTGASPNMPHPDWTTALAHEVSAAYDYESEADSERRKAILREVSVELNRFAAGRTESDGERVIEYLPWATARGTTLLELVTNLEPASEEEL